MSEHQQRKVHFSASREQATVALQQLRTDPEFRKDLQGIESQVKAALLKSGLTENQFEVGSGATGKPGDPTQEMMRDDPYTCLLMLFDECWLWVKIV